MRQSLRFRGFSLIEMIFACTMIAILGGISLIAMRPGKEKLPVRGLANAVADELQAARRLAIATGKPVAIGMPTDKGTNPRASSLYRLEGWNKPIITWVQGYKGDYPNVVFLPARWAGPTFTEGVTAPTWSKYAEFKLSQWLPADIQNDADYIFCYTPDGQLVTNNLSALNGQVTVVVAKDPALSGTGPNKIEVTGADEAITLLLSSNGGIELATGLPGASTSVGNSGGGGNSVTSSPRATTSYGAAGATINLSEIKLLPKLESASPDESLCVPGQVVTLEVYAYDPEGRALFSKWTQDVIIGEKKYEGQFTYPYSKTNQALTGEVDRMEFTYDYPKDLNTWPNGLPPANSGVFRARWNWTVPIQSKPGDLYSVQADVRDVKGEVFVKNPVKKTFPVAPVGRLLVEQRLDGRWQIVTMNPDGSGVRKLTPPGLEECMPSLDRSGSKMAVLQGPPGDVDHRYVKVRGVNGGPETTLAGPGRFTSVSISPDGAWVSYRDDATSQVHAIRTDGTNLITEDQNLGGGGHAIKKSRSGWSQNCRYMVYEHNGTLYSRDLQGGGTHPIFSGMMTNTNYGAITEALLAPISYQAGSGERLLFVVGNNNPVFANVPISPANYSGTTIDPGDLSDYKYDTSGPQLQVNYGGNGGTGNEDGTDNDYPNISTDGQSLVFTQSPQTSGMGTPQIDEDLDKQTVLIVTRSGDNFISPTPIKMKAEDVRRATWIPAELTP